MCLQPRGPSEVQPRQLLTRAQHHGQLHGLLRGLRATHIVLMVTARMKPITGYHLRVRSAQSIAAQTTKQSGIAQAMRDDLENTVLQDIES